MDVQLYSLVTSIFYISDKHFYFKISIQIVKTGSTLVRTPAHFSCSYIKRITRFKTFARESANQEKKWINYWNGLRQLFQHSCLSTVVLLNILSWIIQVMWSVRMTNILEDRTFFFQLLIWIFMKIVSLAHTVGSFLSYISLRDDCC